MQLDSSLPLRERQRLSAKRTHEARQKSTESRIRAACRQLLQQGLKLTQTAIAKLAKLSRQTVAKYRYIYNEVSESSTNVISLDEVATAPKAVKHGVHQIPAPRRGLQESSLHGGDLKSVTSKPKEAYSGDPPIRPSDQPSEE